MVRKHANIPAVLHLFSNTSLFLTAGQVCLGVFTLLYNVPLKLAQLHQLGSITLFSTLWCSYKLAKNIRTIK